ncbi:MAG: type II secretion system protein [bacterium]|nr:type II secretion system protein [bacterium]
MKPAATRSQNGFTLLEVLASAMIFAMVVTVLIGTSSSAVHRAGLSASRLEASLIAEEELALLEADLSLHRTPPPDRDETRDRFAIRIYSEPALENFSGADLPDGEGTAAGGVAAILATQAPGVEAFLLRYEIRVEWIEGASPETIRRTTYAFDWEGARAALPDLFGEESEADSSALGEDGEPELPTGRPPELPQLGTGR